MSLRVPFRDNIAYAKCYCEENVYKLCEALLPGTESSSSAHVIFLTSASNSFPLWNQKSAPDADTPVFWDYHVLLVLDGRVYDHDTRLPWGIPLQEYLEKAIRPEFPYSPAAAAAAGVGTYLPTKFRPVFRVVPVASYLACFSSDRRHMQSSKEPPPAWGLIRGADARSNHCLPSYWHVPEELHEMEASSERGASQQQQPAASGAEQESRICNMAAFVQWCSSQQTR
jgi:hypothetical protein